MKKFFNNIWSDCKVWVIAHGGWTKVGAAAIVMAGLAYGAVPGFHNYCVWAWSHFPTGLKTLFVTLFTLYSWLRNPTTAKIVDGLLGPGDKATLQNPVLGADGSLSGTSATIIKAPENGQK